MTFAVETAVAASPEAAFDAMAGCVEKGKRIRAGASGGS